MQDNVLKRILLAFKTEITKEATENIPNQGPLNLPFLSTDFRAHQKIKDFTDTVERYYKENRQLTEEDIEACIINHFPDLANNTSSVSPNGQNQSTFASKVSSFVDVLTLGEQKVAKFLEANAGLYVEEILNFVLLITEQAEDKLAQFSPKTKWFLACEIFASFYVKDVELPDWAIKLIKNLEYTVKENIEALKKYPSEIRYQYLLLRLFEKQISLADNDVKTNQLLDLLNQISKNVEYTRSSSDGQSQVDHTQQTPAFMLFKNLIKKGEGSILSESGHLKIAKSILNFFFLNRFNELQKNKLLYEYENNRDLLDQFFNGSGNVNFINLILALLNSKGLSIFILEELIHRLGILNFEGTKDSKDTQTFKDSLTDISRQITDDILENDGTTVILWKNHIIQIIKAFEQRPQIPLIALSYIKSIEEQEVITSLHFINKLTGFYLSLQNSKQNHNPIDEFYTWVFTIHEAIDTIIELEQAIKYHNELLTNQLKALFIGVSAIIIIIAASILIAWHSWLIFNLMLASTILTSVICLSWYFFVENTHLNRSNHLSKSLGKKLNLFKQLEHILTNNNSSEFSIIAKEFNKYIYDLIKNLETQLLFITIRMPSIVASLLMGISYGIALSIPIWAYALNVFSPFCLMPAILIATIATLCYQWANMPIASKEIRSELGPGKNNPIPSGNLRGANYSLRINQCSLFKGFIDEQQRESSERKAMKKEDIYVLTKQEIEEQKAMKKEDIYVPTKQEIEEQKAMKKEDTRHLQIR